MLQISCTLPAKCYEFLFVIIVKEKGTRVKAQKDILVSWMWIKQRVEVFPDPFYMW